MEDICHCSIRSSQCQGTTQITTRRTPSVPKLKQLHTTHKFTTITITTTTTMRACHTIIDTLLLKHKHTLNNIKVSIHLSKRCNNIKERATKQVPRLLELSIALQPERRPRLRLQLPQVLKPKPWTHPSILRELRTTSWVRSNRNNRLSNWICSSPGLNSKGQVASEVCRTTVSWIHALG